MSLTKGIVLVNVETFVSRRFGAELYAALVAQFAPEERRVLERLSPSAWYDLRLDALLTRRLCDHCGGLEVARELGRFEADLAMKSTHRWLSSLVRPSSAIQNFNAYWRQWQDTGHFDVLIEPPLVRASLRDWQTIEPALCERALSLLGRVLEHLGGRVDRLSHPRCSALGAELCLFEARCLFEADTPQRAEPLTQAEVPAILQEIAHFTDRDALSDAVIAITRELLGYAYVELWLLPIAGGAVERCRTAGARGVRSLERFLLESAGRIVGWMDIEPPADPDPSGELLADLLPGLALVFDRALALARGEPSTRRPASLRRPPVSERRLGRVERAFRLTRRQRDVLRLMAQALTNKEIAVALGCTEGAVEQHVTQMFRKAGVTNRAGLLSRLWSS